MTNVFYKWTTVKHVKNHVGYLIKQTITATWFSADMHNEVGFAHPSWKSNTFLVGK